MTADAGGGKGSHVCSLAQGVNHGALRDAHPVRNESISMRRNAIQRRPPGENDVLVDFQFDSDVVALREAHTQV